MMNTINNISQVAGFDEVKYNELLNSAATSKVSKTVVDANLLVALQSGVEFKDAVSHVKGNLPNLTAPDAKAYANTILLGAIPSPGAIIMELLTENAASSRKANREVIQSQGDVAVQAMEDEAAEIRSNAVKQLVIGIISGAVTICSALVSLYKSAGVSIKANNAISGIDQTTEAGKQAAATLRGGIESSGGAKNQTYGQIASGGGQILGAVGQYINSLSQAKQKEFQATAEMARNSRDQVKAFTDSLNDLISKILAAQDTIQQGTNQTRTKILG